MSICWSWIQNVFTATYCHMYGLFLPFNFGLNFLAYRWLNRCKCHFRLNHWISYIWCPSFIGFKCVYPWLFNLLTFWKHAATFLIHDLFKVKSPFGRFLIFKILKLLDFGNFMALRLMSEAFAYKLISLLTPIIFNSWVRFHVLFVCYLIEKIDTPFRDDIETLNLFINERFFTLLLYFLGEC